MMQTEVTYEVFTPLRPLSGCRWVYEQRGADVFRRLDNLDRQGEASLHNADADAIAVARLLHNPTYTAFKIAEAEELHSIVCNAAHWMDKGYPDLAAHCCERLAELAGVWMQRLDALKGSQS